MSNVINVTGTAPDTLQPLADEMATCLALAKTALDYSAIQNWSSFEGPDLDSLKLRMAETLAAYEELKRAAR